MIRLFGRRVGRLSVRTLGFHPEKRGSTPRCPSKPVPRKELIAQALDELEASQATLCRRGLTKPQASVARGWIRRQKEALKELKYRGKLPRMESRGKGIGST